MMFIVGPMIEVIPIVFLSAGPFTTTAPGPIIFMNDGIIERAVKMTPINVSLNSAQSLYFCANNL